MTPTHHFHFWRTFLGLRSILVILLLWIPVDQLAAQTKHLKDQPSSQALCSTEIKQTNTTPSPILGSKVVAKCPRPEDARGILIPEKSSNTTATRLARGLLYVPHRMLKLSLLGPRLGFWMYDHYELRERFFELFYNSDRTIGLFRWCFLRPDLA